MSLTGDRSMSLHRPTSVGRAQRIAWIDRTKGVAIILVVFGHALIGLQGAGLIPKSGLAQSSLELIYSFHMPLFFLLSGLTFERAVAGKQVGGLLKSRIVRLMWPLVLWTYIYALSRVLVGDGANNTGELLQWPLPPKDHFWFLWALFLIQLICMPLVWLRVSRSAYMTVALAIAAILCFGLIPLPWTEWTVSVGEHLGVFLLGMAMAHLNVKAVSKQMLLALCALFVGVETIVLFSDETPLRVVVTAALLAVAAAVLCAHLTTGAACRWLATLGGLSMAIYLAHTLFSVATRIVLSRFTEDPAPHLILGTLAGLIGPILLYHSLRRIAPPRVFGF